MKKNKYITIIKTYEFYEKEKQFHLDAIEEIEELLKDLHLPTGEQCYDTGGIAFDSEVAHLNPNNNPYNHDEENSQD